MFRYIFSRRFVSLVIAALMAASLAACSKDVPEESSVSTESSTTESSTVSEEESSEPESSVQEESSEAESSEEETEEEFLPSATDNEEFNKLFADNTVDTTYEEVAYNSGSTTAIVRAANTAAASWQIVIENAYNELLSVTDDADAAKAEQDAWESKAAAEIEKIKSVTGDAEGALVNIEVSHNIMLFYRARAAAILEQVYEITGQVTVNADEVAAG